MSRAKVRPTLADLDDRRKTAAEMAFARIEEEIRECPNDWRYACDCPELLTMLDMAGRLQDCPNCNGKGQLYTHHAPGMPVEECADTEECQNSNRRASDCPECVLSSGRIIP